MTDRLCSLHLRLTLDARAAFTTSGSGPRITVTPTPAGRAWLRDLQLYRREWLRLERLGAEPATILRHRFGYVTEPSDEEPLEAGTGAPSDAATSR